MWSKSAISVIILFLWEFVTRLAVTVPCVRVCTHFVFFTKIKRCFLLQNVAAGFSGGVRNHRIGIDGHSHETGTGNMNDIWSEFAIICFINK